MHKILQTRFGSPGGNCQQAALASLLELPLDEVPDFCNEHRSEHWDQRMNEWLFDRGLFSVHIRVADNASSVYEWLTDNVPCIACVKSKTTSGAKHSVIYHKGVVIHDPHPSQAHRWQRVDVIGFDVLVAIDPAKVVRRG